MALAGASAHRKRAAAGGGARSRLVTWRGPRCHRPKRCRARARSAALRPPPHLPPRRQEGRVILPSHFAELSLPAAVAGALIDALGPDAAAAPAAAAPAPAGAGQSTAGDSSAQEPAGSCDGSSEAANGGGGGGATTGGAAQRCVVKAAPRARVLVDGAPAPAAAAGGGALPVKIIQKSRGGVKITGLRPLLRGLDGGGHRLDAIRAARGVLEIRVSAVPAAGGGDGGEGGAAGEGRAAQQAATAAAAEPSGPRERPPGGSGQGAVASGGGAPSGGGINGGGGGSGGAGGDAVLTQLPATKELWKVRRLSLGQRLIRIQMWVWVQAEIETGTSSSHFGACTYTRIFTNTTHARVPVLATAHPTGLQGSGGSRPRARRR